MNGPRFAPAANQTAVICGIGTSLPSDVLTNDQVIARGALDTTDEWIFTRSGISRRRRAPDEVDTGDLATAAARAAIRSVPPGSPAPDLLVLATTTPDRPCPATAPEVAWRLGLGQIPAFDLSAVCSGFLYALATVTSLVRSGACVAPLIVAAEKYSAIIDPCDRNTAALFGDGAAAVVLRPGQPDEPGAVLATDWGSDGSGSELIAIAAGGSRLPASRQASREETYFRMQGRQVYAHAVRRMTESARTVLASTGWKAGDIRAFIGHQANQRILDSVAERVGVNPRHCFGNIREVGNTAAASIPLALADAVASGARRPGDPALLTAFGGGLTWASATITWPDTTVQTIQPDATGQSLQPDEDNAS